LTIPLTDLGYQHLKILDPLAELRRKQTFKKKKEQNKKEKNKRRKNYCNPIISPYLNNPRVKIDNRSTFRYPTAFNVISLSPFYCRQHASSVFSLSAIRFKGKCITESFSLWLVVGGVGVGMQCQHVVP